MQKREKKFPLQRTVSRGLVSFLAFSVATVLASPSNAFPLYHGYDQDTQPATQAQVAGEAIVVELTSTLKFAPAEITIKIGDTVEWRNLESVRHTVTADPKRAARAGNVELPAGAAPFDLGWVARGQSVRYTFTQPGVYRYVCLPHERNGMLGTVIVE